MNLRSGAIIDNTLFQHDFLNSFYTLKLQYTYKKLLKTPTLDTKYTIANLYIAFKYFCNKEFRDKNNFILYLSSNILLKYRYPNCDERCYICGSNDNSVCLYCENNHIVHLDCFYEKILREITPYGKSFIIPRESQSCDYCNSKFCINA
jgi:hypothetical protein